MAETPLPPAGVVVDCVGKVAGIPALGEEWADDPVHPSIGDFPEDAPGELARARGDVVLATTWLSRVRRFPVIISGKR